MCVCACTKICPWLWTVCPCIYILCAMLLNSNYSWLHLVGWCSSLDEKLLPSMRTLFQPLVLTSSPPFEEFANCVLLAMNFIYKFWWNFSSILQCYQHVNIITHIHSLPCRLWHGTGGEVWLFIRHEQSQHEADSWWSAVPSEGRVQPGLRAVPTGEGGLARESQPAQDSPTPLTSLTHHAACVQVRTGYVELHWAHALS